MMKGLSLLLVLTAVVGSASAVAPALNWDFEDGTYIGRDGQVTPNAWDAYWNSLTWGAERRVLGIRTGRTAMR